MEGSNSTYWAQLMCTTDIEMPPIQIVKEKFIIGRNKGCDWSIGNNKLVSGQHCYIERDDVANVWLCDTSTNGTLINLKTKVDKGQRYNLQHGDEVYVVYSKDNPELNVGFLYQICAELEKEAAADDSVSQTLEQTLSDSRVNEPESFTQSLHYSDDDSSVQNPVKRRKIDTETCDTGATSKRGQSDSNNYSVVPVDTHPPDRSSVTTTDDTVLPTKNDAPEKDAMEETLICCICQEILHDAISLQPCLHSFCSGCYSDWMAYSNECPSCRMKVERINKNHLVNNLVAVYLQQHPDRKRLHEDIEDLNKRNKIDRDMLYKDRPVAQNSDSDDDGNSDIDSDESVPTDNRPRPVLTYRDTRVICRQCPSYVDQSGSTATQSGSVVATAMPDPQPSTSASTVTNPYVCTPNQNHLICACCQQPLPDRDRRLDPNIPPVSCQICYRTFCHAYWGCRQSQCLGCLAKFKDMKFGNKCLTHLILDNVHESAIFSNYLTGISMSVDDLLTTCLADMELGCYDCADLRSDNLTPDTWICYACGIRNFKDLAYHLRSRLPSHALPVEVTARPNCHWGKNCRTQKHKPTHAQRFNHICDQTHFP